MRPTLFSRVFGSYVIIALLGLAILGVVATVTLRRDARHGSLGELEAIAMFTASLASSGALREEHALPGSTGDNQAATTITLLSPDGRIAAGSREFPPLPFPLTGLDPEKLPRSGFARATDRSPAFAYALALVTRSPDPLFVYVTRSEPAILDRARGALVPILLTASLGMMVLGFLIYRALRWIHTPIRTIQAAAGRFARGDLEVALRTGGPAELRRLADDLRLMAEQLRDRIRAISEQRNQLEAILSSMVEGVIVLDDERRIMSINEAAGRLFEVTPGNARGRTLIESVRNAELDELAEHVLGADQPIERTITLYRERPIHLQVHATSLRDDPASRRPGSLLVMNDITRLKRLEHLRKDFVANVSHELKTPITSIKGFVETLLEEPQADPETARRFLRIILDHTNRLNLILEDLLSLSRLEQDDPDVQFRRFSLQPFLDGVLEICRRQADERQITLRPSLKGTSTAWGNPTLLQQALVNLVDNAIKYSPRESRIAIQVENSGSTLEMQVVDHGHGIRARDLPRIFERFYRTDTARSRELGGTGLGLAIAKHVALVHHGTIDAQSVVDQGSTFTIRVPQPPTEAGDSEDQVTRPITT